MHSSIEYYRKIDLGTKVGGFEFIFVRVHSIIFLGVIRNKVNFVWQLYRCGRPWQNPYIVRPIPQLICLPCRRRRKRITLKVIIIVIHHTFPYIYKHKDVPSYSYNRSARCTNNAIFHTVNLKSVYPFLKNIWLQ